MNNTEISTHVPSFLSMFAVFCLECFAASGQNSFCHWNLSPPPAFSSSSMLVLMVLYSTSVFWPPLILLRTSRASWLRPFWRSQRGLSGRKRKPTNCSTAGTTDKPSMYLRNKVSKEWRGEATLKETCAGDVYRIWGVLKWAISRYITCVQIMNREAKTQSWSTGLKIWANIFGLGVAYFRFRARSDLLCDSVCVKPNQRPTNTGVLEEEHPVSFNGSNCNCQGLSTQKEFLTCSTVVHLMHIWWNKHPPIYIITYSFKHKLHNSLYMCAISTRGEFLHFKLIFFHFTCATSAVSGDPNLILCLNAFCVDTDGGLKLLLLLLLPC